MATVTGLTAARMLEIEAASVVNGYINEVGHLILITHGGLEQDAGPITAFTATEEAIGGVELATVAEAQEGTDTTRVVTPAGLSATLNALQGHRYLGNAIYTSSGTFAKADFPGLSAVRVRVVGGGGGGGGAPAAGAGNHSAGGGGGGGGYVERLLFESALAESETITIGAGGGGGATLGNVGGTTSFGTLATATGGEGGDSFANNALMLGALGGAGGSGSASSGIFGKGGPGELGSGHATLGMGGAGGSSILGGGGVGTYTPAGGGNLEGRAGGNYGGGGGGAMCNAGGAGKSGGAGAPGIVIVEVYVQ